MSYPKIGIITCWYKDKSSGKYAYHLSKSLDKLGVECSILSANCLCYRDNPFDPELLFSPCKQIKFKDFYWVEGPKPVQYARAVAEIVTEPWKGVKYLKNLPYPIIHYHQVQGSYGFLPLLSFLTYPSKAKRIVTVHEIDKIQTGLKVRSLNVTTTWLNRVYNKADAIVVMTRKMADLMVKFGVREEKINVIPYGTEIPAIEDFKRDQVIFCGGHHLTSGKGFDAFVKALTILRARGFTPSILIYGLNSEYGQEKGMRMVKDAGLWEQVKWFDYKDDEALFYEFQKSMFAVIPYTTSEVGAVVTAAMANATPVIATRNSGLPEYLREYGLYIKENDPDDLALTMLKVSKDSILRKSIGSTLRKIALEEYSWDAIGEKTANLYQEISDGNL
ncbi:MAG: glycosyltransferase family 4 protein [Caldisphaeraceae archaeon]|nr:glycosyltransferase family 4 protein [Caldisphaeraceae archaeon]